MKIYLDLDDVLCDFEGAACFLHGINPTELHEIRTGWDMIPFMEKILDRPMTEEEFWEPIYRGGADFWANLRLHEWSVDLLDLVKEYSEGDWAILTSPSVHSCEASHSGKVRWIKRHFGNRFTNFAVYPYKHEFARASAMLIDDREESVRKFEAWGGEGLVFPSYGNSLRKLADDPVKHLREMLSNSER